MTVKATANTGLAQNDVFYYGNAVGDVGDSTSNAMVTAADEIAARNNPAFLPPATLENPYDFNRDKLVNATDEVIARNNHTFLDALKLITVPANPITLTWDPDGDSYNNHLGGTDDWTKTDAWVDTSTNIRYTWDNSCNVDEAVFAGDVGTVAVNTDIGAAKLTFQTDDYTLSGSNVLTLTGGEVSISPDKSDTISCTIAGSAGLTKTGSGTLTLTGANNYTGGTTISQGELSVTGSITSAVTVGPIGGGTLSGTGSTDAVTANGTVSPGVGGVGALSTGNLVFATGSHYNADMTDTGYDQVIVTGTVNLGNASLSVTNTRLDIGDDVLVLIQNDGTDSITGTFLNLSEGAEVNAGSATYWITYCYNAEAGETGTGNDVAMINRRPAPPTGLTATAVSTSEIDLSWTDDGASQTGYGVYRSTDGTTWPSTPTATITDPNIKEFHDVGLTEGVPYYYRVQATNAFADSDYSVTAAAPLLETPTGLRVTAMSGSAASLAWGDVSTHESGYSIQQLIDGDWYEIGWTDPSATTATVEGTFEPSTEYSFQAQAWSDWSNSLASDPAVAAPVAWPAAPTDLTATAVSGTEIDLSWTASTGATSYSIEVIGGEYGDWTPLGTAYAPDAGFAVTGLSAGGTECAFRVAAVNTVGSSALAVSDSVPTLNQSPTVSDLTADDDPVTGTSTTLSVTAADDGGEGNLTYSWSILSAPDNGDVWFSDNDTNDAKNTTVTFCAHGDYVFQLTVTDALGAYAASGTLNVTVDQTISSIQVASEALLLPNQYTFLGARGIDQFGDYLPFPSTPYSWSMGAGGVGFLTPPSSIGVGYYAPYTSSYFPYGVSDTTFTISASSGGISGSTVVTIKSLPNDGCVVDHADASGQPSAGSPRNLNLFAPAILRVWRAYGTSGYRVYDNGSLILTNESPENPEGQVCLSTGSHSLAFFVTDSWYPSDDFLYRIDTIQSGLGVGEVTDYASNNGEWVSDARIQDLYVHEDESTQTADVQVDTSLFYPYPQEFNPHLAIDTHLTIKRSDGMVVADDDVENFNSSPTRHTLSVSDQARDFAIMSWLDENGDGVFNAGEYKREVDVHVTKVKLTVADYKGNNHAITQDATGTTYGPDQWKDVNCNGSASDPGDQDFPVCYTRTTVADANKINADVTLKVWGNPGPSANIKVRAAGTIAGKAIRLSLTTPNATFGNGSIQATLQSDSLPNTVCYGQLILTWQVSLDGGKTWQDSGASQNTIYVTWKDPPIGVSPFETCLLIGCKAVGEDEKNSAYLNWNSIVNTIYTKGFATPGPAGLAVKRVDDKVMIYNHEQNVAALTAADMLKSPTGKGECSAWAQLMVQTLAAQGIGAVTRTITNPAHAPNGIFEVKAIRNRSQVGHTRG